MPVLSTKMIPASAARSGTVKRRPPLGWAGFGGNSGAPIAHSSSLTSGLAMPSAGHVPDQVG
jgi:hypothetical protein